MSEQNKIDEIKAMHKASTPWWDDHLTNNAYEYITYLLQEIERLQKEEEFWKEAAENQRENNYELLKKIAVKDEALRFYADKDNYNHPYVPAVVEDSGLRAREAL